MSRIAISTACLLGFSLAASGCADTTILPGFDGPLSYGKITKEVDILSIEQDVQCEINDFLTSTDMKYPVEADGKIIEVTSASISNNLLAFDQPATVTLTVQTDLSGKVTAAGLDFAKLGLSIIANAVTIANKAPSLQASLSGKDTISAAPTFVVPQSSENVWSVSSGGAKAGQGFQVPVGIENKTDVIDWLTNTKLLNSKAKEGFTATKLITGLGNVDCESYRSDGISLRKLYIAQWMFDYFTRNMGYYQHDVFSDPRKAKYFIRQNALKTLSQLDDGENQLSINTNALTSVACDSKLVLKTSVFVTFDTSAGLNPLFSATYLLPVSGMSIDVSPDYIATLEIDFMLENRENNQLCTTFLQHNPPGSGK